MKQSVFGELLDSMRNGAGLRERFLGAMAKRYSQDAISRAITAIREEKAEIDVEVCARVLVELGDQLEPPNQRHERGSGVETLVWIILQCEKDKSKRARIVDTLIAGATDRNSTLSHLVHRIVLEHEDAQRREVVDPLIAIEDLTKIKTEMASTFLHWYDGEQFKLDRPVVQQFYAWRWCDPTVDIKIRFESLVANDDDFLYFLDMWMSQGIHPRSLWDFIDKDTARHRLLRLQDENARVDEWLGRWKDLVEVLMVLLEDNENS